MKQLLSLLAVIIALNVANPKAAADSESIVQVTVCELLGDPAAYNHRLIKITGIATRGFEHFTLSDPNCENRNTLWLEFGGRRSSEVVYCCYVSPAPTRRRSLRVEGINTRLVADRTFQRFQDLSQRDSPYSKVKTTIVGRYFSGTEEQMAVGPLWVGYGHFGLSSLLVIQQVLAVEAA